MRFRLFQLMAMILFMAPSRAADRGADTRRRENWMA